MSEAKWQSLKKLVHLAGWSKESKGFEGRCIWVELLNAGGLDGKEFAGNAGDLGLIPGLGRFPGEQNNNALQYSCLENSRDKRAWQATVPEGAKSEIQLSD